MSCKLALVALLSASAVAAEADPLHTWRYSAATLASASIADAHSSWRGAERNPLLADGRGQFGGRGVAIKGSMVALNIGLQYVIVRRWPRMARPLSYVNFGGAAVTGAVAARNYGVRP